MWCPKAASSAPSSYSAAISRAPGKDRCTDSRITPWLLLPIQGYRRGFATPRSHWEERPWRQHLDRRHNLDARDGRRLGSFRSGEAVVDRSAAHLRLERGEPAPHTSQLTIR